MATPPGVAIPATIHILPTVSNGKVTAKAAGKATVTVSDGNKSATCNITVTAPMTLTINTKAFTTVSVGNTLQIDYTYSGDKSELTWSSDDASILTVNNSGLVTGKSAGTTGVIVTNGSITRVVSITVSGAPKATSIEVGNFNAPLYDGVTKYVGDYMNLRAWTLPAESNPDITVTSNNNSVVSVSWNKNSSNMNDVTLKFKGAGKATITIKSADGAVSKSYTITVNSSLPAPCGTGQLSPQDFVKTYNAISSALGMSTSGMPSGYLVMTCSDSELTWDNARNWCASRFHEWWGIGYRTLVLTYEGTNENGNHVFHVRGY